ncbi:HPr family phosphocarrier protein [Bacillus taeanensis]|uniref:Phosphocarrier protein HPr n=1 Tax=Bacillus taeanensis TaxID=273032 RepID=A0A366XQV6_9BACI|nr:HPr family phosphocarrier protein [Bacillus taeanensis]RBW68502.1 phosphocarrier protein HPr [Bacillus taeanensis]
MIVEEIVVKNRLGFHLRPATMFASIAQKFSSEIKISYNGRIATGKSAIGLLKLEIEGGEIISIKIDGEDEIEAMKTLTQLMNRELI